MTAIRFYVAAIALASCGGTSEATNSYSGHSVVDEDTVAERPVEAGSVLAKPSEIANLIPLRESMFYRLEWAHDVAICASAIAGLNRSYSVRQQPDFSNYAEEQAEKMLGTTENVLWTEVDGRKEAKITYFNDDVERQIVRMPGMLSGNQIIGIGIKDADGNAVLLNFGHAGSAVPGLPAIENLHAKLTYSVTDIIELDEEYFTTLAPLADFDNSGVVFLISWDVKVGAVAPYEIDEYYPQISCIFSPARGPQIQ